MYQIDFNKPQHIYFMGIGGISMSGLAEILMDEGFTVSGSDSNETELTEHLRSKGSRGIYRTEGGKYQTGRADRNED